MFKILKYSQENFQNLVLLMEKLQDYIVEIDPLKLNIRTHSYWNRYTRSLVEKIMFNQWIIYLLYDEQKCIWCIAWIILPSNDEWAYELKKEKMWEILELYVDGEYRWKRLWKQLMQKIEEYFKEKNCKYLFVDVFSPNINAYEFYEKMWYYSRMQTLVKEI